VTHPAADHAAPLTCTARSAHRGQVIVTLAGDLDIMAAPALREQLLSLLRPGASRLIIDLSAVGYADASGLAVLLGSQRRAGLPGGALQLAAPRPQVASVLAATGMSRHFDVYPTIQAAITGQHPAASTAGLPAARQPAVPQCRAG
jgi:anti-anti-sigma factor